MEKKISNGSAVLTVAKSDLTAAAKALGYTLTSKEQQEVLELLCDGLAEYVDSYISAAIKLVKTTSTGATTPPATTTTTVDTKSFKWYYHSKDKNETKSAIAAALDADRPMLIMACKPNCGVCELVWKNLKATGTFAKYLKDKKLVGLKVDDTASHFLTLSDNIRSFVGIDGIKGTKVNRTAPFFALVRLKSSMKGKTKITIAAKEVSLYISGYGNASANNKTYNDIVPWLNDALNLDALEALA